MAFLEKPNAKQEQMIKEEMGEKPGDMENCVRDLRSMLAASPYLPDPDDFDSKLLELFVAGCRMDMERARTKLEAFCLARVRHRDLYEHRSFNEPPLDEIVKFIDIVTLPKLTDEGLRVSIFRVKKDYPEGSADLASVVKAILLVGDARMHDESHIAGDVFIYEVSQVRSSIVAPVAAAAGSLKRGIQLAQAAYPQRLKRIHVVGASSFLTSSIQLVLNFINEKVRKRYHLHAKPEDLLDHIPARVLPAEWGGEEESIEVIAKKWRHRIDESSDFLNSLNEVCQKTKSPIPDTEIYGAAGAFRKLDID